MRRNLRSDFVGGAYVFPGGAVDPSDAGARGRGACAGRSDAEASEILGVPNGGLAYWVAVRGSASRRPGCSSPTGRRGGTLSLADPAARNRLGRDRTAVNAGERRFLDVCSAHGLTLATDRVHYFAHWITPQGAPRRYDTRFFVAAAPPDQRRPTTPAR